MWQGCAQISEPNGGPSDRMAPECIPSKTLPQNRSTFFKAETVEIAFNEYIQVKSQLVTITPEIKPQPSISAKGKKLLIKFNAPLKENTTYTINLSGAINDITENNAVGNLTYVFSTGSYIDSMSVSGTIKDAFSGNGISGTTVLLHDAGIDSAIFTSSPLYYLKTDKNGTFQFNNIKKGNYKIYSLIDKNADLKYSGFPEEIGFDTSVVQLDSSITNFVLLQSKQINTKLALNKSLFVSKHTQVYKFSSSINEIQCQSLGNSTFKFFHNTNDSILNVTLLDTLKSDTAFFVLKGKNKSADTLAFTAHLSKKMKSKLVLNCALPQELYAKDSIVIKTNSPYAIAVEKIILTDTLHKKSVSFKHAVRPFELVIYPVIPTEKIPVNVVCLPGAFKSTVTKSENDTLNQFTLLLPEDKCGGIEMEIKNAELLKWKNAVIVLTCDGKKITQQKLQSKNAFQFLKPGKYKIYVFDDHDGSMQWSPSDFKLKKQAEPVIWFNQEIKVKSNWQQNLTWI